MEYKTFEMNGQVIKGKIIRIQNEVCIVSAMCGKICYQYNDGFFRIPLKYLVEKCKTKSR